MREKEDLPRIHHDSVIFHFAEDKQKYRKPKEPWELCTIKPQNKQQPSEKMCEDEKMYH